MIIFDTTLRDGEQAPGASLTPEQKLEIATALEKLGVDVIEAGFPVASTGDFQAVSAISKKIKNCKICGLARSKREDIEACAQSLKKAKRPRIHVFLATSEIHRKYKLKKAKSQILELASWAVGYARKFCDDVEFSPEDASRTEEDFLLKVIEEVIKKGARTINIPDTVGWAYPEQFSSLISNILNKVPNVNKATISVHCHNDLGLAVANSLAAVKAGANQVHCTINGIGERAGNASLEEVVMTIKTRSDIFKDIKVNINTPLLYNTSRLVSRLTGFVVAPNKAIVGRNAFRHESGIHQDGILKERRTYEIISPRQVGFPETELVLGKHSGKHAFKVRLEKLGFYLTPRELEAAFEKFKELADKKKEIFNEDLIAIVEEKIRPTPQVYRLVSWKVITGEGVRPQAEVGLRFKNKVLKATSWGDGPVDACFRAIDRIIKKKAKLLNFRLQAVTRGKDALGEAYLELKYKNNIFTGTGASTDIIEASLKAYLAAVNKFLS